MSAFNYRFKFEYLKGLTLCCLLLIALNIIHFSVYCLIICIMECICKLALFKLDLLNITQYYCYYYNHYYHHNHHHYKSNNDDITNNNNKNNHQECF